MRRALLLLCACACAPLHLDRPVPPPEAQTEVFILGRAGHDPRAFYVADARSDHTFAPVPIDGATRFEIVYLGQPPAAYDWEVGQIFPPRTGEPVRDVIGEGKHFDLEGEREWLPRASWRNDVRVDLVDPFWCLTNGQCLDRGQCGQCNFAEPRAVPGPNAVRVECPDGWFSADDERGAWCRPFEGEMPQCGPGTYVFSGDADCVPAGPACPTDLWADALGPDTIYVAPNGTRSGAGDRASPWDLTTALARAPRAATIALARGEYDLGTVTATNSLQLVGACEAQTHLIADVALARNAELSGVAVEGSVSVAPGEIGALRSASVTSSGIALDVHGALNVDRVALHSGGVAAVDVHRDASLNGNRLTVLAAREVGVRTEGAEVSLGRLLTIGLLNGVAATDTTLALRDSAMIGARAGIHAYNAAVTATRIAMHDGISLVASLEGSNVEIGSAWTLRTRGVELDAKDGDIDIMDLVSIGLTRDPETTAAFMSGDDRSTLAAKRVRIVQAERRVEVAAGRSFTMTDVDIVLPPLDDEALTVQKPTVKGSLTRVRIVGSPRGLQINSGEIVLDDITITANDGLCQGALGGLYVRSGDVSGSRVAIDVTGRPGLVVDPEMRNPPTVKLADVSVRRRPARDPACDNGAAVQVFGTGNLELTQFEIAFEDGIGAAFFGPYSRLRGGTFVEGAIGVDIRNPQFSPDRVSDQVRYRTGVPWMLP